jgi:transposase
VFLPPCSPDLNLIERLWWLLKKTALWNEYCPTFAGFKAAIDGFFRNLGSYRKQLTSLITDHFRFIGAPKSQPPWAQGYTIVRACQSGP